jgi:uncharacterized protein YndB with AHSA1/START domain
VPSAEAAAAVEREIRVDAAPETVFDFFTDPDKMIQWMGRHAELEPSPGGTFRVDINGRDIASGAYVVVDPPRRVVFTWGWESEENRTRPGTSTVEVSLESAGEGTVVRLLHRDLATEESRANHGHGWIHYLERLAVAAPGGDPGADPWSTPQGADEDFEDGTP